MRKRRISLITRLFLALIGIVLSMLGFHSCSYIIQPCLYGGPPTPYNDSIDGGIADSIVVDTLGKIIKSDTTLKK